MFSGSYRHQVDAKGRVAVPVRFREELGGNSMISLGPELVLTGYPEEEWRKLSQALAEESGSSEQRRRLTRVLFGSAQRCEFDNQGRVLLSPELRRRANLQSQVVIVGSNRVIEIWPAERWDEYLNGAEGQFTQLIDMVVQ